MRTIKSIRQLYNNNIKLLNRFGFIKIIKQIFVMALLIITMSSNHTINTISYAQDNQVIKYEAKLDHKIAELKTRETIKLTNEERQLLIRLISSESKGECYKGQVAVASVVINRVLDPRFPNSIKEVIYQTGAFEPVANGTINLSPVSSAEKALEDALRGKDPTNNAVYFWNPDKAKSQWIKTLNPYLRIGNHVFAK